MTVSPQQANPLRRHLPRHDVRTIYLIETIDCTWVVRVAHSPHENAIDARFSYLGDAEKAFVLEGSHQPFASMLVLLMNCRPCVIRSGSPSLGMSDEEEADLFVRVQRVTRRERDSTE